MSNKSHRLPFHHVHERSSQAFDNIHIDTWGPSLIMEDWFEIFCALF